MSYLVEIENVEQGASLVQFLRTLSFVKIHENVDSVTENLKLTDFKGKSLSNQDINDILAKSELSGNMNFSDSIRISEEWKNQL